MINVGDILRFVAKTALEDGTIMTWVFHQLVTAGSSEADLTVLTALRDHLDTACTLLEPHVDDNAASTECELYVWNSAESRFDGTAQIDWTTFVGTATGVGIPNQNAILVKFFTNVGRRQARKYLGGLTKGAVDGSNWTSTPLAAALGWSAILDDALVTGNVTCTPCVFNLDVNSPLYLTTETLNGITAVDTIASSQRRRKVGVGI